MNCSRRSSTPGAISKRILVVLGLLGLSFLFSSISATSASAHAQLTATYPLDGSTSKLAPKEVALTWGEDVKTTSNQFSIVNNVGTRESFSFNYRFDSTSDEGTVKLIPSQVLPKGSYIVSWKVISHDGHLVGGAFSFGVNVPVANAKQLALNSYPDEILQVIFWIFIIISFGSIVAERKKQFFFASLVVITTSALRLINSYSTMGSAFLSRGSSKISLLAIASFLVAVLVVMKVTRTKLSKALPLFLIAVAFSTQALFEGHPLDISDPSILRYISVLHLLFALFWTGSVVALGLRPTKSQYAMTRVVSAVSILLVILFGSILSVFLALPIHYPGRTSWILFFIIKIGLVLVALLFGTYHHFVGKKISQADEFRLGRTLGFEVIVMAGGLLATSIMVSYTPPKVLLNSYLKPTKKTSSSNDLYTYIPLKFDNGSTGTFIAQKIVPGSANMLMVQFDPKSPIKPKSVDIYLSNAQLKIVDLHVKLVGYSNQFMAYGVLPSSGTWRINVQALIDDFSETQANVTGQLK